jgi:hypothetical protein
VGDKRIPPPWQSRRRSPNPRARKKWDLAGHSSRHTRIPQPRDFKDISRPERHDPIEDDPKYASIFRSIDDETTAALEKKQIYPSLGYCHTFWVTKQKLLRKKYGLDWKSPSELNPATCYD